MSTTLDYASRLEEKHDSVKDEKTISQEDGKQVDLVSVESIDSRDVDEALNLVGMRRTAEFSEEYNRKLRRKLVCAIISKDRRFLINLQDWVIPPLCAAVYFTQFLWVTKLVAPHTLLTIDYRDKNTLSYAR